MDWETVNDRSVVPSVRLPPWKGAPEAIGGPAMLRWTFEAGSKLPMEELQ